MITRWQGIQSKKEAFKSFGPDKQILNLKKMIRLKIKSQTQKLKLEKKPTQIKNIKNDK